MPALVEYPTAAEMLAAAKAPAQPDTPEGRRITHVPSDAWDRIVVALLRSIDYLPRAAADRLRSALDLKTVQALAVILAVWAGFTIAGLGAIATTIMGLVGAVTVGSDLWDLFSAGKRAALAERAPELENAAKDIAAAITALGVDVVLGFLTSKAMTAIKKAIDGVKGISARTGSFFGEFFEKPRVPEGGKSGTGKGPAGPTKTPGENAPGEKLPEKPPSRARDLLDLSTPGVLAGVGTQKTAEKAAQIPWPTVLGVSLGAVAVAGAFAFALTRPARKQVQNG